MYKMAKKKNNILKHRKFAKYFTIFTVIIVGIAGWAFYSLLNESLALLLGKFGVENVIIQNLIIVLLAVFLLAITGAGVFKAIEKIIE